MTRKCYDCKATKNLKGGWVDEDEMKNCSFCCKCFFDNEYDNDGLEYVTKENWNDYDYYWKLKKGSQFFREVMRE